MLGPSMQTAPHPRSSHLIEGWWTTATTGSGTVVPDGAVDLMWTPGTVPFIAGPDTRPRPVALAAGAKVVGLRLRPGVAQVVLGDNVNQATDRLVTVDEIWQRSVVEGLTESLHHVASMTEAASILATTVNQIVPASWSPDCIVVAAISRLRHAEPLTDLPISERQLRRRFTHTVGYGPAFFRRISRLDLFTHLGRANPAQSIAEVAAAAGYFDEAHLWRDAKAITGTTPGQMRSLF